MIKKTVDLPIYYSRAMEATHSTAFLESITAYIELLYSNQNLIVEIEKMMQSLRVQEHVSHKGQQGYGISNHWTYLKRYHDYIVTRPQSSNKTEYTSGEIIVRIPTFEELFMDSYRNAIQDNTPLADARRVVHSSEIYDHPEDMDDSDVTVFDPLRDKHSLRVIRDWLLEHSISTKQKDDPLSEPVKSFGESGIALHENSRISYRGNEIQLSPQERRIAVYLMKETSRYSPIEYTKIATVLGVAGSNPGTALPKAISRINSAFKTATGSSKAYFISERNIGYYFYPNSQ